MVYSDYDDKSETFTCGMCGRVYRNYDQAAECEKKCAVYGKE